MTYHRPTQLSDALRVAETRNVRVLAGGTDIYPALDGKEPLGEMLDITAIPGLSGISRTKTGWRIGATTRWSEVSRADLPAAFHALQQAARQVGSMQIQNSATVAGNICNASPAADGVPPLLVLDAEIEVTSTAGTRRIPLQAFITGVRQTALQKGEIVTALHIPETATHGGSAFQKLGARKYMVISIAMVAARVTVVGGKIIQAAVSVGACSPVATRLAGLERAMVSGQDWQSMVREQVETVLSPIGDIRADAAYRNTAAVELIKRTIEQAIINAGHA